MKKKTRATRNRSGTVVAFQKRPAGADLFEVSDAAALEQALGRLQRKTPEILFLEVVLAGKESRDMIRNLADHFELKRIQTFTLPAFHEAPAGLGDALAGGEDSAAGLPGGISAAKVCAVPKKSFGHPVAADGSICVHNLVIHPGRREAYVNGYKVDLTFTLFNILHYLACRPGWVFTNAQIMEAARGPGANFLDSTLKTHICNLRRMLGPAGELIESVPGVGYRLKDDRQ
jgi:two-component system phosphate regulon response regulator PhoB